jgi:hypothetical protein
MAATGSARDRDPATVNASTAGPALENDGGNADRAQAGLAESPGELLALPQRPVRHDGWVPGAAELLR